VVSASGFSSSSAGASGFSSSSAASPPPLRRISGLERRHGLAVEGLERGSSVSLRLLYGRVEGLERG
jgi:hypothetical protein